MLKIQKKNKKNSFENNICERRGKMNILKDWIKRLKKVHMFSVIMIMFVILIICIFIIQKMQASARQEAENSYNYAFHELVNYVQNVEVYLEKAMITSTPEHGIIIFTHLWREANLASTFLSQLPVDTYELQNTEKFLNQVSDFTYSLSRKNIDGIKISEEEYKSLEELHEYSIELENTLNILASDLNSGNFKWGDIEEKATPIFASQEDNINENQFDKMEENLHEFAGLIYDGAYSEHIVDEEKVGLTGEDVSEEEAKDIIISFLNLDNYEEISSYGYSENADIPSYNFSIKVNSEKIITISVSKKGGHVIYFTSNLDVKESKISSEDAVNKGREYLIGKGYESVEETYFLEQSNILTINYAYMQDNIIVYPDLIKLKISLSDGEILGIETQGYLNNNYVREIEVPKMSYEEAKQILNENIQVESERLAIIPTEWKEEILCYEFKGQIGEREFLIYINAITGKEEEVLLITDTPGGKIAL